MLRTMKLLLLANLLLPALFPAVDPKAADAIRALDKQWALATINKDFVALDQLLADDVTFTHSSARMDNKSDFMESLRKGTVTYRSVDFGEIKVRIYGDTAVSTSDPVMRIIVNGTENTMKLRVLHVWRRTKGRWQLVARQATRIVP
jgi:ketosteroid isomerase-like protein